MEATGYCWKCGLPCKEKELFCCDKHKEQFERKRGRQIKTGKRASYGITGSTH